MKDDFNRSKPIYMQLAERINRQIIRQEIKAGEKLSSVREMAIQSGVNPNTVQRTYSELERMGIVETRRGQGTFVTEKKETLIQLRETLKLQYLSTFVHDMQAMGFSEAEMVEGLQAYFDTVQGQEE